MMDGGRTPAGVPGMAGLPPSLRVATSFQPLFSVHSAALAGHEALARPVNMAGQPVCPTDYFATRSEAELKRVNLECRRAHLARFAALDEGKGFLYLNIHPRAVLAEASVAASLRDEIGLYGLAPSRVCLEIIEDESGDEGLLAEAVAACRAIGVRVAMDDFGIARSNFDRMAALEPDFVKIDRSLLVEAVGCAKARRLLPSVVRLLHDAGTQVVVEGIEVADEALFAIEAGADYVQGFFFGAPRPGLHVDPAAGRLLAQLKKLRISCEREPEDCEADPATSCLARLLVAGRSRAGAG
jgi:EAL domain-containing protein (putative c-di-GMP-specific phosphodiesterase class I)